VATLLGENKTLRPMGQREFRRIDDPAFSQVRQAYQDTADILLLTHMQTRARETMTSSREYIFELMEQNHQKLEHLGI
jgi:hypothetical protein